MNALHINEREQHTSPIIQLLPVSFSVLSLCGEVFSSHFDKGNISIFHTIIRISIELFYLLLLEYCTMSCQHVLSPAALVSLEN